MCRHPRCLQSDFSRGWRRSVNDFGYGFAFGLELFNMVLLCLFHNQHQLRSELLSMWNLKQTLSNLNWAPSFDQQVCKFAIGIARRLLNHGEVLVRFEVCIHAYCNELLHELLHALKFIESLIQSQQKWSYGHRISRFLDEALGQ